MRVVELQAVYETAVDEGCRCRVPRQAATQDVGGPKAAQGRRGVEVRRADPGSRRGKGDADSIQQMQATELEHVLRQIRDCYGADPAGQLARQGHGLAP